MGSIRRRTLFSSVRCDRSPRSRISVNSIIKWYLVVIGTATVTLCVQSRHLIIQQFLYESHIHRTATSSDNKPPQLHQDIRRSATAPVTPRYTSAGSNVSAAPAVAARRPPGANLEWTRNGLLYEVDNYNISIISAVGRNRSTNSGWDDVILTGWEGRTHINDTYNCCIYYHSGDVTQVRVSRKTHWLQCNLVPYIATQLVCPNNGSASGRRRPMGIALIPFTKKCLKRSENLMKIYFPERRQNETIGLCAKIAYGTISPSRLIEWYEIQRVMGVTKVITFTYNLTGLALKVLKHYQALGFVELRRFQYPHEDKVPRAVGEKNAQSFNDEQVVAFDCVERLSGYQFVGLLDHDEYLVPTPAGLDTWQALFKRLLRHKPDASGFSFRTELFVTDWGKSGNSGMFFVTQFLNRTRPLWDRRKNVFMPSRVVPGTAWTHNYADAPGYEKFLVTSGLAAVKHYRTCRKEWTEKGNCFTRKRHKDQHLLHIATKLNHSLVELHRRLLT